MGAMGSTTRYIVGGWKERMGGGKPGGDRREAGSIALCGMCAPAAGEGGSTWRRVWGV